MLYRVVVAQQPDPADPQRRLYRLDCGHVVSRRTYGNKRRALCTACGEQVAKKGGRS